MFCEVTWQEGEYLVDSEISPSLEVAVIIVEEITSSLNVASIFVLKKWKLILINDLIFDSKKQFVSFEN